MAFVQQLFSPLRQTRLVGIPLTWFSRKIDCWEMDLDPSIHIQQLFPALFVCAHVIVCLVISSTVENTGAFSHDLFFIYNPTTIFCFFFWYNK